MARKKTTTAEDALSENLDAANESARKLETTLGRVHKHVQDMADKSKQLEKNMGSMADKFKDVSESAKTTKAAMIQVAKDAKISVTAANHFASASKTAAKNMGDVSNAAQKIASAIGNAGKKTDENKEKSEKLKKSFEALKEVSDMLGFSFAIFKGMDYIKDSIKDAEKAKEAQEQLANSMRLTGTYSKEAYSQAVESAEKMAHGIKFSTTEMLELQTQLRGAGTVGSDQINRVAMASADMATRMGGKASNYASMLSGSMASESVADTGRKMGIDASALAHVQQLAKSGKEAEARMEFLALAEKRVGGAAKEVFANDPMAQFKKSQEEISEKVGNMALTLQNILAPAFTWVSERISGAIDLLKPLTNFLQEHQTALQVLSGAFIGIGGVIAAYEIKTRAATLATTVLTAAEWLLDLAMEANPVGIVVVAIAAFVGMLIMAYEKVGWFRDIVNATWDTILDFAHSAKEFLTPFLELWDKLSGAVQSFKKHIVDGARSLLDGFLKPIKDFIESHKDLFDLLKKIFKVAGTAVMLTSPVGIGTLVTSKFFGSETFQKNLTREEKTRKEASDEKKVAEDPKIKPTAEKPTQPTTPATDISPQPAKGNNPVTINITIGKQIEKLVLNTTHLREGVDEIEKQIVKVMLNAVNQSQMIAHI